MDERIPAHVFAPGEYIRDEFDARSWSVEDFAKALGLTVVHGEGLLSGEMVVTPEIAVGLGEMFATGAQLWTNLESTYRRSPTSRAASVVKGA